MCKKATEREIQVPVIALVKVLTKVINFCLNYSATLSNNRNALFHFSVKKKNINKNSQFGEFKKSNEPMFVAYFVRKKLRSHRRCSNCQIWHSILIEVQDCQGRTKSSWGLKEKGLLSCFQVKTMKTKCTFAQGRTGNRWQKSIQTIFFLLSNNPLDNTLIQSQLC